MSIRWKLIFLYIGTIVLILAVFIGGDVIGLRQNLMARVDDRIVPVLERFFRLMESRPELLERTDEAEQAIRALLGDQKAWLIYREIEPGPDEKPSVAAASGSAEWPDAATARQRWLREDGIAAGYWTSPGGAVYRVRAELGPKKESPWLVAAVGYSADDFLLTWTKAIRQHVLLALILVAAAFVIGYAFIRQTLRPVGRMVRTARSITGEDLSLRIDAPETADEIGELARTLNDMIARIEKSFAQLKRFSADAAHELKTPITVLRGELEVVLRKPRAAEEYAQTLSRLLDEVKKLSTLIDDLLFLSVVEENREPIPGGEVSLDRLVLESYEEVLPLAREKGVTVGIDRLDEAHARGEPNLIRRMIVNFLTNAVKFTPQGGRVHVTLESDPRKMLAVRDTGIGIPEDQLPFLFERFYRVDQSRSKLTGGAGLGLAIVKEIARIHRIEIEIRSRVGEGTEVRAIWMDSPPIPLIKTH